MREVLYFAPAIFGLVFYSLLAVFSGFGAIHLAVWLCIAMLFLSAVLMAKKRWFGFISGIMVGVILIWMSFQSTGQVIDIEMPLGIGLIVFYLFCGYSLGEGTSYDDLKIIINDVQAWIDKEKPYQYMTEEDKCILPKIGISINSAVRRGKDDISIQIFDRLIRANVLQEDIVVYRGVEDQEYELSLAKERGLDENYLYSDGYIYCSLNADTSYWNRHIRMIIFLPAGTHYLFTGAFSNTPESNEIILDKNTIMRIDKELYIKGKYYIWVTIINET